METIEKQSHRELAAALGEPLDAQPTDILNRGMNKLILPIQWKARPNGVTQEASLTKRSRGPTKLRIIKTTVSISRRKKGDKVTKLLKTMRQGTRRKLRKHEQAKADQADGVAGETDAA